MGLHLLIVVLSPPLLCLAGAGAAALWPRRSLLWLCLVPAWALALLLPGLGSFRDELAGPVVRWCRLDTAGLAASAAAMPLAALSVRRHAASSAIASLRASPWRYGVLQAACAVLGVLPLPALLVPIALLRPWSWRVPAAPAALSAGAAVAVLSWPWPGMVDLVNAVTLAIFAATLRPVRAGHGAWIALAASLAVLSSWRAATLAWA